MTKFDDLPEVILETVTIFSNKMVLCNSYEIKYNDYFGMWQVSHDEIGACIAEFKFLYDALIYCGKG